MLPFFWTLKASTIKIFSMKSLSHHWLFLLVLLHPFSVYVCVCVSCSVTSDSLQPHGLQPTRLPCPWDSPGKNTGVVSHSLLQGSTWPRDWTPVSCTAGRLFIIWVTREALPFSNKFYVFCSLVYLKLFPPFLYDYQHKVIDFISHLEYCDRLSTYCLISILASLLEYY